ncbi:predicted protein [Naegleria gruberi]|uniref:Predicted protein n=1 Tax=Naegleria gruberi TaxID=5762 RepID=D2VXR4_NAEGR|nr:uncharacterized protein NAEGRDRAFT_73841 [Naegleria gruberi]EFC38339.1 predicted protein [Naegleria gruberi]|eukprot:XP_002671083.1 predicted protein [Naegleria gruberi strain NEG-M]
MDSEQVLDIKVQLTMHDVGNLYNVYLWKETENGPRKLVSNQILTTISSPIPKQYTVRFTFLGDPEALFVFEFEKRTEAFLGTVTLSDVQLISTLDVQLVEQETSQTKGSNGKLIVEFLGDSLSCAYGNLGKPPCGYSVTTQDVHQSFVVKTAQYLQADEYHVECYSGKGVVRNYADPSSTSKDPYPVYYPRTVANQNISNWNFTDYIPSLVVITLGGNDFSTAPRPSYEQYYGGYINLLNFVYGKYLAKKPDLKVVLVCGPLEFDCWENYTERVSNQAAPQFPQNSLYFLSMHNLLNQNTDIGCASHPNVQGDEKMAKLLSSFIQNKVLLPSH